MKCATFAALMLAAVAASAGIDSTRFAHPRGDYAFEYPSGWKRSVGLQAVLVRPPGESGRRVSVTLERYPLGKKSPDTPEAFEAELRADVGTIKTVDSEGEASVAGRRARKLSMTTTAELKGDFGVRLPGPHKELYFILPKEKGYFYVLKLVGVGQSFDAALPEFGRIAQSLKLAAPSPVPIQ
jgi:hypothetical protein